METTIRNKEISMAKGVAIILMVLAHAGCPMFMARFISMFHMPLFFFFSGYCLNEKYFDSPVLFVKRRIKGLWKPFVKWSIIFLLLHNFFLYLNFYHDQDVYSWSFIVSKMLRIAFTFVGEDQLLGGYWFLRDLFWASIFSFFILLFVRRCNKTYRLYILPVLFLAVALLINHLGVHAPTFGWSYPLFMAMIYYVVGYIFRKQSIGIWSAKYIISAYALVFVGVFFWNFDMLSESWLYITPYVITAILGSWGGYSLCYMSVHNSNRHLKTITDSIAWIGNNTLTILTWHFLSFKLVNYVIILAYGVELFHMGDFPYIVDYALSGWWVVYFIVGMIVPILIVRFRERFVDCHE